MSSKLKIILFCFAGSLILNFYSADGIHQYDSSYLEPMLVLKNRLQEIENSLLNDQTNLLLLLEKGSILFQLQKYDDSLRVFDQVLSMEPDNNDALRYKGHIYETIGNHPSAFQFFYRIYQLNNTDTDAIASMSYNLLNLKKPNPSLALVFLDQALKIDPNNQKLLIVNGIALNKIGLYENSQTYFQSVLDRFPDNVLASIGLAERSYLMGNYQDARKKFLQLVEENPINSEVLMGLGKSTLGLAIMNSKEQGKLDEQTFFEALKIFQMAESNDDINASFYLAETYFEMAKFNSERTGVFDAVNYEHAIPFHEQYLAQNPTDVGTLQKLGDSYHNVGEYEKSIYYYDRILKINPTHGFAKIGKSASINKLTETGKFTLSQSHDSILIASLISVFIFAIFSTYKLRAIVLKEQKVL